MAAVIYHVEGDPEPQEVAGRAKCFAPSKVQVIIYLNKTLSNIETRYPATELEMAGEEHLV